jgi:hydroxyacylglutathione hydrolase
MLSRSFSWALRESWASCLRPVRQFSSASGLKVSLVPCLSDNYAYLLTNPKTGLVAVVDPSEAEPVMEVLEDRKLKLDFILNTHHHHDHVGGNEVLKQAFSCTIVGPKADEARIPGIDIALAGGEEWDMNGETVQVIDTPGHTSGHVAFHLPNSGVLFSGDTLFALGCGRLFEGTPAQMFSSLSTLAVLPADTLVYCGHEYTAANAAFALAQDPDNQALQSRCEDISALRAAGKPTVPSTVALELATNPFLRSSDLQLRASLEKSGFNNKGKPDVEVFAELRKRKDNA